MFLLDTNVLSETRRGHRIAPGVEAWMAANPLHTGFISVVSIMELERGIHGLGRRDPAQAAIIGTWLTQLLADFAGRILTIDIAVARRCAPLHVPDKRPEGDAYLAATCLVHGLSLVTRNVADFRGTGVKLINPWDDPGTGLQEASGAGFADKA